MMLVGHNGPTRPQPTASETSAGVIECGSAIAGTGCTRGGHHSTTRADLTDSTRQEAGHLTRTRVSPGIACPKSRERPSEM
jgi:hypothetical protein